MATLKVKHAVASSPTPMREEIIAVNPLPRFLSERGYELRPAGRNFVTNACPVAQHKKYHRCVTIDTEKNLWHCNDCDRGGTVIDWVMLEKNVSAADAMRILGDERNSSELPGDETRKGPPRRLIAKTYDYNDEAGTLLFQCVRFLPKHFSQRRPDGKGGWVWNLEGVRRVLYRLPEVLKAQRVCVPEGEKDCDNLHSFGFTATTNPMGAGNWLDEYAEALREKDVVIFSDVDDDEKKKEKVRQHVEKIVASLIGKANSIRLVVLPDGFKDISDYIDFLRAESALSGESVQQSVASLIEQAQPVTGTITSVQEPEELRPVPPPYEPPPLDLLPPAMQTFVRTGAKATDVDTAFLFLPVLSETAACIGISRSIRIKEGWIQPPIVWTSVVAESGEGKDPAMQAAIKPQLLHEFTFKRENDQNLKEYKKKLAKWEATKKSERGERPESPALKTCLMDDATLEAIACRANDNPRGILLAKAELSHWFGSFDQYRDRTGADLARWLQLYDGILFAMDRVTGNRNYRIPNPRISIAAGVQPDTLRRILTDEYFERGLPARFRWAMPKRTKPRRFSKITIPPNLFAKVSRLLSRLRELKPYEDEESEVLMPVLLSLSSEAERIFEDFYNEVGRIIDKSGPRMRAQWSKLIGGSAALALVGQLAHNPDAEEISGEIMEHACALARWFGKEAARIYATLAETREQREQRELIAFVESRGRKVTVREVTQLFRPLKNNRDEAERRLNALVRAKRGEWTETKGARGPATREFQLLQVSTSTGFEVSPSILPKPVDVDTPNSQKNEPKEEPNAEAVSGELTAMPTGLLEL